MMKDKEKLVRFRKIAAQGELGFMRISDAEAKKLRTRARRVRPTAGMLVVGHSETGHHHVMDPDKSELYQLPDELTKLLIVTEEDVLRHKRDYDTHQPMGFEPGAYKVRQLREYVPETMQSRTQYD